MKAYEFALADPLGQAVAKQAMTQLAKDPKQKPVADQKLLELYQALYDGVRTRPQQRPYAEPYVDALVAVGEYRFGQGEVQEAAELADTASKVFHRSCAEAGGCADAFKPREGAEVNNGP